MTHDRNASPASQRDREPRVIEIMPDGRRIVDPMSIIDSESARRHLEDIAKIREDIARDRNSNGSEADPSST